MAEKKLASPIKLCTSYNVSSVVFVLSMISLGCILILNLVDTNLLMYLLPGMILFYLATLFYTEDVFG